MKKVFVVCVVLILVALVGWGLVRWTASPTEAEKPRESAAAESKADAAPHARVAVPRVKRASLVGTLDLSAFGADVRFDVDGNVVVDGVELSPGNYALRAMRDGFVAQESTVVLRSSEGTRPTPGPWVRIAPAMDDATRRLLTDLAAWDAAISEQRRLAAQYVVSADSDFKLAKMESFSSGGQTHEVAVFSHDKTGLEFVLIPSGTFQMGSPTTERGRDPDETPQHAVTLTRPYLICRTECTQSAYERVVGSNPSELKTPARPVETVSWNDVKAFCDRSDLRLPTEAEWEYACRAGTTTAYCFGDDVAQLHEYAWFERGPDGQRTAPVAQRKPNGFGLYDMHGNVWEWCADWRAAYTSASATDPSADVGTFRASRGGSSENGYANSRSAKRGAGAPDDRIRARGFRPAKSVGP